MSRNSWFAAALALSLCCTTATGSVWHVYADGSGDAPTIQAALDLVADQDTVLVGPGTYHEHNVLIHTPRVTLVSSGGATATILDAAGGGDGFAIVDPSTSAIIIGFTIVGAEDAGISMRGSGNAVDHFIDQCVIRQCGAGIYARYHIGTISNVTVVGAVAGPNSGAGFSLTYSYPILLNCISAFNEGYGIVSWTAGGGPEAEQCCDIFGNEGGNYFQVPDPTGTQGNISLDPLFCDYSIWNLYLAENSPCAPYSPQNPDCDLVGALPVGCQPTPVEPTTWGSVKARFFRR